MRWGAPFGRRWRKLMPKSYRPLPVAARLVGPFAFQPNSVTRTFEYPWAFEALNLRPGMQVLEIGGGLSGFRFVLARRGCSVVNVDPGDAARGKGWPVTPETFSHLNQRFGTDVSLENCFVEEAGLPTDSFDRVVAISVVEHIPPDDIVTLLDEIRRVLKPGGLFVMTLDLFLDVAPFTDKDANKYGSNISVKWLVDKSRLEMVHGDPQELYGFDEFDADRIKSQADLLVGSPYPVMVQTLVLRKPEGGTA
jgi:SAM-dependent methyltransferase